MNASASAQPPQECEYCGAVDRPGFIKYNVPLGHEYYGKAFPCPRCNARGVNDACGLYDHERSVTLADLETDGRPGALAMLQAGQRFTANPIDFLSVYGPCGNGKTILLQAIVNACISIGIQARYITAHQLMGYLYDAFDPKVLETDQGRITRLATIPVLVIDEFTDARDTPYAADMQKHLIDERYRNKHRLGTVFCWNGNLSDIPWPKVASRMAEGVCVENTDEDMRPEIGAAKAKARG